MSVSGSQKGLMMPPGLAFNALSDRALAASKVARLPRSYWDWEDMLKANGSGFFLEHAGHEPACTGSVKLWGCCRRKGSPNVFERHRRHAEATRAAVRAWDLELVCEEPSNYSNSLTAVMMPEGHDADRFRAIVLEKYDMSLGAGLGKLSGRVFRIGHLGAFNDLDARRQRSVESRWGCESRACSTGQAA